MSWKILQKDTIREFPLLDIVGRTWCKCVSETSKRKCYLLKKNNNTSSQLICISGTGPLASEKFYCVLKYEKGNYKSVRGILTVLDSEPLLAHSFCDWSMLLSCGQQPNPTVGLYNHGFQISPADAHTN